MCLLQEQLLLLMGFHLHKFMHVSGWLLLSAPRYCWAHVLGNDKETNKKMGIVQLHFNFSTKCTNAINKYHSPFYHFAMLSRGRGGVLGKPIGKLNRQPQH